MRTLVYSLVLLVAVIYKLSIPLDIHLFLDKNIIYFCYDVHVHDYFRFCFNIYTLLVLLCYISM